MPQSLPRLVTAGLIAERLQVPLHRVQHVLNSRPAIRPLALAGHVRLYTYEAIGQLREEIEKAARRRSALALTEQRP
jgi:hypothetical protein